MKKLKSKNYQRIVFVCRMKLLIVHEKNERGEHEDDNDGSDAEYGCSRPYKRARDGSHCLP